MQLFRRFSLVHATFALAAGAFALALAPYLAVPGASANDGAAPDAQFGTISAQRINIVDPDGTMRMAIANQAYPPELIYRGETYPERSIDGLTGIVFYEDDGDETGGLGVARLRDMNQTMFIFDFTHQLTDGIGIMKQEKQDGSGWKAGLFVRDRRPYEPGTVTSTQGTERIWLANEDQDASLIIADPQGRPRIRIGVDAAGEPAIQIMDEQGELTYSASKDPG
jgi:ABC-type amino acid transport substrate-binding protein